MLPAVTPVIVAGIVVFGLVGLANFAIRRRLEGHGHRPLLAPPSVVPEHTFDEGRSVSFRGGSRVGQANATAPLIRLRADERWIHITGGLRLFGGPPPVWIERGAVDRVGRVSVLRNSGIRFEADDGRYDSVIFWTSDPDAVLDALRERGWPVSDNEADTAQS
jgi:hypothetical protein